MKRILNRISVNTEILMRYLIMTSNVILIVRRANGN